MYLFSFWQKLASLFNLYSVTASLIFYKGDGANTCDWLLFLKFSRKKKHIFISTVSLSICAVSYSDHIDPGWAALQWADGGCRSSCLCAISAWSAPVNPSLQPSLSLMEAVSQQIWPALSTSPSSLHIIFPLSLLFMAFVKTGFKKKKNSGLCSFQDIQ